MAAKQSVTGHVTHRSMSERAWGVWTGAAAVDPPQDNGDGGGQELPQELPSTPRRTPARQLVPDHIWRVLVLVDAWGHAA